ncbi:hypothetical protein H5410_046544 [Solanum commersonii]|uniref:Uncharacterized protein n=1 Tax=Solanum commersonii TaxID=4109 RepID=A0A9J5XFZ4_SOLCO|nr:hypothetical protein H5410_046544 [Solanum commersonii]
MKNDTIKESHEEIQDLINHDISEEINDPESQGNEELSISSSNNGIKLNQSEIMVENVFAYNIALNIMQDSEYLEPLFVEEYSRAFNSVLLELLDDVDLLEMWLISKNIGKRFVISSRSPGRILLTAPSKSYVVGLPNLTMKVEVFMNVYSFFETCRRISLPNLTTRVEVFMNALLRLQEYLFLVVVF